MSNGRKWLVFSCAALVAAGAAIGAVFLFNASLWNDVPFPGPRTAREAAPDSPWLEPGIARLQSTYAFPIGLLVFLGITGTVGALLFLPTRLSGPLTFGVLFPFVGFWVAMLFIPIFLGFIGPVIANIQMWRHKMKCPPGWLELCYFYNCVFAIVSWCYLGDWFSVFGD